MDDRRHVHSAIALAAMSVLALGSAEGGNSSTKTSNPASATRQVPPTLPAWTTFTSRDEMTGKQSCHAHSPATRPEERMAFPYADVSAWLGVGYDGASEWVYVGFSDSPNLLDTNTGDGYSRLQTRVRWDDTIENVTMTQEWGAKFLQFDGDVDVVRKIAESQTVLLELNWYGSGRTFFRFSLNGSPAAIATMRDTCDKH
jgi:hypothetical protein